MKTLLDVLREVIESFERLDIPYVVGGSFASSAWGQPRQTRDLDVSLWITSSQVEALTQAFQADWSDP